MTNIDNTLAERGSRYGDFEDHAQITQNIKAAISDSPKWSELDADMKEALEMVAHKIGRIVNGDPNYIDSWTDIVGYTRLVEKRLIAEQTTAKVFAFPDLAGAAPTPVAEAACTCEACQLNEVVDQMMAAISARKAA